MNNRSTKLFTIAFLLLCIVGALFAQSLPQGQFHRTRERIIDIVHFGAKLSINPEEKTVQGEATVIFHLLRSGDRISLDAIGLDVESVSLIQKDNLHPLEYHINQDGVSIQLDETYSSVDTLTVSIKYSALPKAGMYFLPDPHPEHDGQTVVYTYGEGGLAANWLPIYSEVNDRFSTEMDITVPEPYAVISNGVLIDKEIVGDDVHRFHWKQDLPHPAYLISIYIGQFERGELEPAFGTIPVAYWVPAGRLEEGAKTFQNTTRMIEFFSERFGFKYPWDKYDQLAVPDYHIGAMEHTGVTGHRASILHDGPTPVDFMPDFDRYYPVWTSEAIVSHELAHHWFGNAVTCRNHNNLWLNESFATYCNMLWDEELLGSIAFDQVRREGQDRYMNWVAANHTIRPLEYAYYDSPGDMYIIEHTYIKGALILHMLRHFLGDDAFFAALKHYMNKHAWSNVESPEFKVALEEATGQNFDWFFNDWIYGGGYPVFEVNYTYLKSRKMIDLVVNQIQPVVEGQDLFNLPVDISIHTAQGIETKKIWVEEGNAHFFLPCEEMPLMIGFDSGGHLVADIVFNKSLHELLYQIEHDAFPGRIRAMRQATERFSMDITVLQKLSKIISGNHHWWLKAEATLLLGKIRTPNALKWVDRALKASDYRIRKAAVLALPSFPKKEEVKTLKRVIQSDKQNDVVATAIVALSRTVPGESLRFILNQMNRRSWYDEIRIACVQALGNCDDENILETIRPFTGPEYHEILRITAMESWKNVHSEDPKLAEKLLKYATDPQPGVQLHAIGMLGSLYVEEAIPVLQDIIQFVGDEDVVMAAFNAIGKIQMMQQAVEQ